MGEPARKLATYDDVLAAPEHLTAEIVNGELHLSPRPGNAHALASGEAYGWLWDEFGRRRGGSGPGGWWILAEPELHLGRRDPRDTVLVPDLAGWRRDRMLEFPDEAAFTLVPDWVCEVLSPGAAAVRRDRIVKVDAYAQCGVAHLWLVDPVAHTLEVYTLTGGVFARTQAFTGDVRVRAVPFDAVEIDLGGWWLPEAPEAR